MAIGIGNNLIFGGALSPILANVNFTSQNAGFASSIRGVKYECASSSRTVQTSDTAVVTGGGVDAIPIGRLLGASSLGLALDGPQTNECVGVVGGTGWTNSGSVITTITDPANGSARAIEDANAASTTYVSRAGVSSTANVPCMVSVWLRPETYNNTTTNSIRFRRGNEAVANDPNRNAEFFYNAMHQTEWRRYQKLIPISGTTNQVIFCFPCVGNPANANHLGKCNISFANITLQTIPSEYYDGTRLGAAVGFSGTVLNSGRIGFELDFYPRNASADYAQWYAWGRDANNYMICTPSDTKIYINGSLAWTASAISWSAPTYSNGLLTAQPRVQLWAEIGGTSLQSVIKYRVNAGAVTTLTSSGALGNIVGSGDFSVLSSFVDKTQYQLGCHLRSMAAYKSGKRPAWTS